MRIALALSGGVDSSIALYLLKRAGHELFALFMKNWKETGDTENYCPYQQDFDDAQQVCQILGVPLYGVDFSEEYWETVFTNFIKKLKLGYTPNPDILCNKEIKFHQLFKRAKALGADALATGHYCRTNGKALLKASDCNKDQSYFLYAINGQVLKHIVFPIGHMQKSAVRDLAQEIGLPVFNKKDSTGICFIGKRDFQQFLKQYIPHKCGIIETIEGKEIGTHEGIYYYTIGQRKGIKIGGAGEAYFVIKKDLERNVLIVAQGANHPALFASGLMATNVSWIEGCSPTFPLRCFAKIRYRQLEQPCIVKNKKNILYVHFDTAQRAITPGQSIVFYKQDRCLGGAVIERVL